MPYVPTKIWVIYKRRTKKKNFIAEMAQAELAQENNTSEQNEVITECAEFITECAENPSFERYGTPLLGDNMESLVYLSLQ